MVIVPAAVRTNPWYTLQADVATAWGAYLLPRHLGQPTIRRPGRIQRGQKLPRSGFGSGHLGPGYRDVAGQGGKDVSLALP